MQEPPPGEQASRAAQQLMRLLTSTTGRRLGEGGEKRRGKAKKREEEEEGGRRPSNHHHCLQHNTTERENKQRGVTTAQIAFVCVFLLVRAASCTCRKLGVFPNKRTETKEESEKRRREYGTPLCVEQWGDGSAREWVAASDSCVSGCGCTKSWPPLHAVVVCV